MYQLKVVSYFNIYENVVLYLLNFITAPYQFNIFVFSCTWFFTNKNCLNKIYYAESLMTHFLGGDYMIPFCRDEILSRFAGSRQYSKLFINFILWLHGKKFHPGKAGSRFCTARIPFCRDEIFPCNCFSPPKRGEKIN